MAGTTITVAGVTVTDVTPYRAQLTATRARLATIYAAFNPARPELLLAREAEIVELANNAERLREIVERWDEAETRRNNVLAVWELVKAFKGDDA
ncbi:hypothetical protein [Sphingomonas sp. Leaf25]|uniref:hypothetical protein n=1 Tax=Sphingomonas sp. Leaf25 TaxID=1735692 RepID=UPI0007007140|nr:hypothetical protein [Sphingomonas sp. Leaf25]KQM99373.1 hypothetical protein ASE78_17825 [Sphingomonas sp. Leaf25]